MIDADLLSACYEHYTVKKECFSYIMEVALACCAMPPVARMNMENVVSHTQIKSKSNFLKAV